LFIERNKKKETHKKRKQKKTQNKLYFAD